MENPDGTTKDSKEGNHRGLARERGTKKEVSRFFTGTAKDVGSRVIHSIIAGNSEKDLKGIAMGADIRGTRFDCARSRERETELIPSTQSQRELTWEGESMDWNKGNLAGRKPKKLPRKEWARECRIIHGKGDKMIGICAWIHGGE